MTGDCWTTRLVCLITIPRSRAPVLNLSWDCWQDWLVLILQGVWTRLFAGVSTFFFTLFILYLIFYLFKQQNIVADCEKQITRNDVGSTIHSFPIMYSYDEVIIINYREGKRSTGQRDTAYLFVVIAPISQLRRKYILWLLYDIHTTTVSCILYHALTFLI